MSELNNTFTRPPSGFQGHKRSKFSSRGHQTQGAIQRLQSNCLQSLNNRMTHTWLGLLCTRRCIIDNFIWIVYYYLFALLLLWNIVKNKSFCSIIILNYFLFNQIRLNHWFKIGLKIWFKGSSDSSHLFEINFGKSRIRHITNLNLNLQSILSRSRNSSFNFSVVICRIRLFPTLCSKIKWLGSGLPLKSGLKFSS